MAPTVPALRWEAGAGPPEERGRRVGTFYQVTVFPSRAQGLTGFPLLRLPVTVAQSYLLPSPASLTLWRNHTAPPRSLMMQETFYTTLTTPCEQRAWEAKGMALKVPPRPFPSPSLSPDFLSSLTFHIIATCRVAGSSKSKRVPEKHVLLLYWLHQSLWLCGSQQTVDNSSKREEYQTTWPAS